MGNGNTAADKSPSAEHLCILQHHGHSDLPLFSKFFIEYHAARRLSRACGKFARAFFSLWDAPLSAVLLHDKMRRQPPLPPPFSYDLRHDDLASSAAMLLRLVDQRLRRLAQ